MPNNPSTVENISALVTHSSTTLPGLPTVGWRTSNGTRIEVSNMFGRGSLKRSSVIHKPLPLC